ncbi:AAA family ATPase [Ruania rhizosphaerae]|uniref:AAA family ATPase n=1 Tax=Ruania rhizosphaerae TaxID=1840413 RepID=UPI00135753F6|nr:AAA family ATPase [Ruania rhizosphaerae]
MRIANYGGIRRAELHGLAQQSVLTVTGRNGTGKSLLLEAMTLVLTNRGPMNNPVGPWGSEFEASVTVVFDEAELQAAADWLAARRSPHAGEVTNRAQLSVKGSKNEFHFVGDEWAWTLLNDEDFRDSHPFVDLSFLPAVRAVQANGHGVLELDSLDPERVRRSREEGIDRALSRGEPLLTPTVSSQLTALDYLDLLATREKIAGGELQRVVRVFETATGKKIVAPSVAVGSTARFEATLADGERHSVNDLSSGERAMLSLLFYVRRVATQGGILLIDEPEQHLHPTLVAPLMASMVELAPEAQIFVVSHAAGAIAAAAGTGVLVLDKPHASGETQLRWAKEDANFDILSELGVSVPELLGVDALVVVEGRSDEEFISSVFPLISSRVRIVKAGGVNRALKYCDTLTSLGSWVKWICVIDRDLRTAEEVAELTMRHPQLFVWQGRDLESVYLSENLISSAYRAVGWDLEESRVREALESAVQELRGEVISTTANDRVLARAKREQDAPQGKEHGRQWLRTRSAIYSRAAETFDDVRREVESEINGRWESDSRQLVDPKLALNSVVNKLGYFSKQATISSVLRRGLADGAAAKPDDLQELERRLSDLVQSNWSSSGTE